MNDIDLVSPRDLPAFADWQALALKALKGAELASLTTHLPGGLTVEPLYIAPDEAAEPAVPGDAPYVRGTRPFVTEREADEAGGAAAIQSRRWDIRQRHAQADPAAAHGALLDDLTGGVTSILLQMAAPGQPGLTPRMDAMATALGGEIALNMIGVHLDAGEDYLGAAQSLMEIWRQAGLDAATARGGFGADPFGAMWLTGSVEGGLNEALATLATFTSNNAGHYPQVSFLSCNGAIVHDAGATAVTELAVVAAQTVAYLRALETDGMSPNAGLATLEITLGADTDQFLTIAKVRACRQLIGRISHACGAARAAARVQYRAQTSQTYLSAQDTATNLIRNTVACAGAAMAGADAITVLPHTWGAGQPDGLSARMARNIQIILQEEAFLGDVADPAGGSWYVEALTAQLAEKAWAQFQEIEQAGGLTAHVMSGKLAEHVAQEAAAGMARFASGEAHLIGVTAHTPQKPENLDLAAWPAAPALRRDGEQSHMLQPTSYAQALEAQRSAA